jgi:TetR/AcrR family transcriptional regulator
VTDRRQRDKVRTIQDILNAARRLFSEKGLHGTSLRDLENASGVSKGLILHHFESKENLYNAVQDLLIQEYTAKMAARRDVSKDLLEMITNAVRESLSHNMQNTEFRRIALWSYLEGLERSTELEKRFTTSLINGMRMGQESGLVRDDINAFLMPFIIRGTIDYWIRKESLRAEVSAEVLNHDGTSEDDLVDALVKLMLK